MDFNDDSAIVIVAEYEARKISREEAMRRLIALGYTHEKAGDVIGGTRRGYGDADRS